MPQWQFCLSVLLLHLASRAKVYSIVSRMHVRFTAFVPTCHESLSR